MKKTIILLIVIIVLVTGCNKNENINGKDIDISQLETKIGELNQIINDLQLTNKKHEEIIQKLETSNEEMTNMLKLLESNQEEIHSMYDKINRNLTYITNFSEYTEIIGYVTDYGLDNSILHYDMCEWIGIDDITRINELGLDSDNDFPNSYYIYNEEERNEIINLANDTSIYLLDGTRLEYATLEDLEIRAKEYKILIRIIVIDSKVVEVSEIYRP